MKRFVITEISTAVRQWVIEADSRKDAENQWRGQGLVGVKPQNVEFTEPELEDVMELKS